MKIYFLWTAVLASTALTAAQEGLTAEAESSFFDPDQYDYGEDFDPDAFHHMEDEEKHLRRLPSVYDGGGGGGSGLIETKPCIPWENISGNQKGHDMTDGECVYNDCDGCCRAYHWLLCDKSNFRTGKYLSMLLLKERRMFFFPSFYRGFGTRGIANPSFIFSRKTIRSTLHL
jgi:hypothetical protein